MQKAIAHFVLRYQYELRIQKKDKLINKWINSACGNTIQMSNINKSISKKLLSFPLKLSSASEMLIKD